MLNVIVTEKPLHTSVAEKSGLGTVRVARAVVPQIENRTEVHQPKAGNRASGDWFLYEHFIDGNPGRITGLSANIYAQEAPRRQLRRNTTFLDFNQVHIRLYGQNAHNHNHIYQSNQRNIIIPVNIFPNVGVKIEILTEMHVQAKYGRAPHACIKHSV
ncbi:hypothetical protein NPIL_437741 [Nephila pilipes]|uniref:Uncharacterized protein n=1 Tax=Nephila pilipes TaxID=299642 RepID=A0A8X6TT07_NEPPI|nr:hypothetical protein NPIL_437741 [Nephila pilipes]